MSNASHFEKWIEQYGHSDKESLHAAWQASEQRVLDMLGSEDMAEIARAAIYNHPMFNNPHCSDDFAKAALTAIIERIKS